MGTDVSQIQTDLKVENGQEFTGSTCVVTGASGGIGQAIASELCHRGATVVVHYHRSDASAKELVATIDPRANDTHLVQANVREPSDVARMAQTIADAVGEIDILINNAGVTNDVRFERMSAEAWRSVIDVNLHGTYYCTREFFDDIAAADHGRVINVSSVIGQRGNFGQANYAASKSALFGFTRSIAKELAPTGSTANCVAPGFTATDMIDELPPSIREEILRDIPLDRFASPAEIAAAVAFLASPAASYVTGEVLNVNGGMYG